MRAETAQVERAVTIHPSAVGYVALALVLNVQGRPTEALMAAENGVRFDQQSPFIIVNLGWAYDHLGRWRQGLSIWKRYLALYGDDIEARASLAMPISLLELSERQIVI
jgi:tetratricopeptide (TPR) repeat protein